MIDGWLALISESIKNITFLAPLLALAAGVVTSLTPCALTSVPLVIAYVGGAGCRDPRRGFSLSAVFCLGMALTFTALGVSASVLGRLMGASSSWWYIALGILMLLMALQLLGIFDFIPSSDLLSRNTRKGHAGAFLAGILGGFFSSPCASPVLVVLLGFVAQSGNMTSGVLLLLLYSMGHSVLVLVAGTSISFVNQLAESKKFLVLGSAVKYVLGVSVLLVSFVMFYMGF